MKQRLWIVLRVQDYRVTALADVKDPCWEEISGDTIISEDRESMFQLARRYGGLLCSAEGLPSPRQADRFRSAMDSIRAALAGDEPEPVPAAAASAAGAHHQHGMFEEPMDAGSAAKSPARSAGTLD